MTSAVPELQQLGFTQYEAQAYVTLLSMASANGYELARSSGIPRPNIYTILQKLEERGAILRMDSLEGTRYAPVPPEELLAHLKHQIQENLDAASGALYKVAAPSNLEPILNTRGYEVLLDHARTLIGAAQQRLLLAIWPQEAAALAEPLREAEERGVQITTLCLEGCPRPCSGCRGDLFRYHLAPSGQSRWLILIPDDAQLLAGEISPQQEALGVRTCQKMLVNLAASYIQNSIALAAVLSDAQLSPSTRIALNALHSLQGEGSWLEEMRQLIHLKE